MKKESFFTLIGILFSTSYTILTPYEDDKVLEELVSSHQYEKILKKICPLTTNPTGLCYQEFPKGFKFTSQDNTGNNMEYVTTGGFGVIYKHNKNRIIKTTKAQSYAFDQIFKEINIGIKVDKLNNNYLTPVTNCCSDKQSGDEKQPYRVYIEMPLYKDKDLNWFVQVTPNKQKLRTLDWKLKLMIGIVDGIQAFHELGYYHQDFHRGNIFMQDEDHPRIGDFGLSGRFKDMPKFILSTYNPNPEVNITHTYTYRDDFNNLIKNLFCVVNSAEGGCSYSFSLNLELENWCDSKLNKAGVADEEGLIVYCKYFDKQVFQKTLGNDENNWISIPEISHYLKSLNITEIDQEIKNEIAAKGKSTKILI